MSTAGLVEPLWISTAGPVDTTGGYPIIFIDFALAALPSFNRSLWNPLVIKSMKYH